MKFLIDMNLSPRWVGFLVECGFEAVHWSKVGAPGAPDSEVMRWAADNAYIVVTSDLGFATILAASQIRQPSVIQIRSGSLSPESIGGALLAAIRQAGPELQSGALLSVDAVRGRVRILPLSV
jgi:predicted nuclease of predicted toxin-antitoxin system